MINDWFKSAFDGDAKPAAPAAAGSSKPAPQRRPSTRTASRAPKTTAASTRKRAASATNDATIDLTTADDADDGDDGNKPKTTSAPKAAALRPLRPVAARAWLEQFAPRTAADLAVHPKKIEELQQWLERCTQRQRNHPAPPPMLCLSGPAGVGKTAALRLLATAAGYAVSEWVQPVDAEQPTDGGGNDDGGAHFADTQTQLFEQFLFRASRYRPLFDAEPAATSHGRLVLVEDFPNVFVREPAAFEAVLDNYSQYGRSPLVFVCTDSRSRQLNLAYTLLGDAVRARYAIDAIAFNAVSATLMRRALRRIAEHMQQQQQLGWDRCRVLGAHEVDAVALRAQGDLRNAMITLQVLSAQRGGDGVDQGGVGVAAVAATPTAGVRPRRGSRATRAKTASVASGEGQQMGGCDETITLLHALGRVLNPKYAPDAPDRRLLHSPEHLADDFTTQPQNFLNLLQANYAGHFGDVEHVRHAADALSISDRLLAAQWRDPSEQCARLALLVAVRGCMAENRQPASGWRPIRGARSTTKRGKDDEPSSSAAEAELRRAFGIGRAVTGKVMAADYRTYAQVIAADGTTRQRRGASQQEADAGAVVGERADADGRPDEDAEAAEMRRLEQSIVW